MLNRTQIKLHQSATAKLFKANASRNCQMYFGEIACQQSPGEFDALLNDLHAYEHIGLVTPRVADMKRRAECMVVADRIIDRPDRLMEARICQ